MPFVMRLEARPTIRHFPLRVEKRESRSVDVLGICGDGKGALTVSPALGSHQIGEGLFENRQSLQPHLPRIAPEHHQVAGKAAERQI